MSRSRRCPVINASTGQQCGNKLAAGNPAPDCGVHNRGGSQSSRSPSGGAVARSHVIQLCSVGDEDSGLSYSERKKRLDREWELEQRPFTVRESVKYATEEGIWPPSQPFSSARSEPVSCEEAVNAVAALAAQDGVPFDPDYGDGRGTRGGNSAELEGFAVGMSDRFSEENKKRLTELARELDHAHFSDSDGGDYEAAEEKATEIYFDLRNASIAVFASELASAGQFTRSPDGHVRLPTDDIDDLLYACDYKNRTGQAIHPNDLLDAIDE